MAKTLIAFYSRRGQNYTSDGIVNSLRDLESAIQPVADALCQPQGPVHHLTVYGLAELFLQ